MIVMVLRLRASESVRGLKRVMLLVTLTIFSIYPLKDNKIATNKS